MMSRFKVGDLLIYKDRSPLCYRHGDCLLITRIDDTIIAVSPITGSKEEFAEKSYEDHGHSWVHFQDGKIIEWYRPKKVSKF